MRTGRMKRGFTLIETVVTVGIVAAMAAVVIPQVAKQFDAADPTKAAEDLNNISTALATFEINVRPHQPSDLEDLVNQPSDTASTPDRTARNATYSSSDKAAWQGPYLSSSIKVDPVTLDTVLTTGFGGSVLARLALYDVHTGTTGGDSVAVASIANVDFIAVVIKGLSYASFKEINDAIDGSGESTETLKRHTGRLRCPGTFTANDPCATAYYLASPLR